MSIFRRRLMMGQGESVLPYNAEIEYIGSNSSASGIYQYIDTGIVSNSSYQIHIKVGPITTYPTTNGSLFITSWASRTYFMQINETNPNAVYWHSMNPSAYHELLADGVNDIVCGNKFITVNGTTYTGNDYFRSNASTIKIFNNSNGFRSVFDLYLFEIISNDTPLMSLKPVRVGTEGCLYDTVSKQLFHNAGTGSFILGPDV